VVRKRELFKDRRSSNPAGLRSPDLTGVRVSVVIPAFNAGTRLDRTLRAALAQTAPAHEIIVIDDGSTDDTGAVCARFAPAVRCHRVPNGGQQRARNLGVDLATGDWIALLDQDDLWHSDYLAEVAAFLAAHDGAADLMLCDAESVQEAGQDNEVLESSHLTERAPAGYWAGMGGDPAARWSRLPAFDVARYPAFHPAQPSLTCVSIAFWRRIGGFDPRMRGNLAENLEFEMRALRTARVGVLWRPLVTVVNHDSNLTKDRLGVAMDLVDCLAFVRDHHDLTQAIREAVEREIQARLPAAIAAAFSVRDFARVRRFGASQLGPADLRIRAKRAIAALPAPAARLAAALVSH